MIIIRYDYDRYGYTIVAERDRALLTEYAAGNDPLESSSVLDPFGPRTPLTVPVIAQFARQTAQDMKSEHQARRCFRDRSLRSEIRRVWAL